MKESKGRRAEPMKPVKKPPPPKPNVAFANLQKNLAQEVLKVPDHLVPHMQSIYDGLRKEMERSAEISQMLKLVFRLLNMSPNFVDRSFRKKQQQMAGLRQDDNADPEGDAGPGDEHGNQREMNKGTRDVARKDDEPEFENNDIIDHSIAAPMLPPPAQPRSPTTPASPDTASLLAAIHNDGTKRKHDDDAQAPNKKPRMPNKLYVGDWKCGTCGKWNNKYCTKCQGKGSSRDGKCNASSKDAVETQADDGIAEERRTGRYAGDWYCNGCSRWHSHTTQDCWTCGMMRAAVQGYRIPLEGSGFPPPPLHHPGTQQEQDRAYHVLNKTKTPKASGWKPWDEHKNWDPELHGE